MQYNFEWNRLKALSNAKKHGVTFKKATEVFKIMVFDEEQPATGKIVGSPWGKYRDTIIWL